jgi:hypothetical protein
MKVHSIAILAAGRSRSGPSWNSLRAARLLFCTVFCDLRKPHSVKGKFIFWVISYAMLTRWGHQHLQQFVHDAVMGTTIAIASNFTCACLQAVLSFKRTILSRLDRKIERTDANW